MKDEIYVIGDIHGYYDDLVELINKLPNKFESKICFVGDLIDRGPDSQKVVELVKSHNYDCVLGNHELMCIEYNGNPYNQYGGYGQSKYNLFGENGGRATLESYGDIELLQEDIEYFKTLPLYIKYKDLVNDRGQSLIVSHSCCLNYLSNLDNPGVDEYILWNRDVLMDNKELFIRRSKDLFNIFGHTITDEVVVKDSYASVETGVARKEKGKGKLSCIAFPSMEVYSN